MAYVENRRFHARHVEDFHGLPIGAVHREMRRLKYDGRGALTGSCKWDDGMGAGVQATTRGVTVDYRTSSTAMMTAHADIEWKPCRFGGQRPWLVCPKCGRTTGTVYLTERGLQCRRCLGVRYRTQDAADADRMDAQADKVRGKLNADGTRPKGMHRATYERLREKERRYRDAGRHRDGREGAGQSLTEPSMSLCW